MPQVIDLNCPGCGGPVGVGQKECNYCHRPIYISMFNSVFNMKMPELRNNLTENPDNEGANFQIAMGLLINDRLYDNALPYFEKAIASRDNTEALFYAAVCQLKGLIAFCAPRANIDKAVDYLNAALRREPKGIYHYFLAYIKYDYFERKYLNITPNWKETLQTAIQSGVPQADVAQLFEVLQVEKPECLSI
ncbi:MAG: hypothetical protein FWF65_09290 [Bacteroidetes bacterium]|nr:hypothetical protein [Bacteroidota bacterium]